MVDRPVRATRKDQNGDITAVCCDGSWWSPRSKDEVIRDIQTDTHRYFVEWTDGQTRIRVVDGQNGPYLRTDKDSTSRNNLHDLPDC